MAKRRFIIHIGAPKTGSTAIQSFCHHHRAQLLEAGVLYPAIGPTFAHHALPAALRVSATHTARLHGMEAVIEQTSGKDHQHVLISSEGWLTALNSEPWAVEDFCQFWEARGYEVEFVMLVRDLPEWLESACAQQIKTLSTTQRFRGYATRFLNEPLAGLDIFEAPFKPPARNRRFTAIPFKAGEGEALIAHFFGALDMNGKDRPQKRDSSVMVRNKRPSARRVEACRRLGLYRNRRFGAAPPGTLKWDWGRIGPMLQVIREAELKLGWESEPFHAVTEAWARKIAGRCEKRCDRFAQRVWDKPWRSVVHAKESYAPPTEFDRKTASKADDEEISEVIRTALQVTPVQDEDFLKDTISLWPRGPGPKPTA